MGNVLCNCSAIPPTTPLAHLVDLLDEMGIHLSIHHTLHHGQMLQVIMCLEQRVTCEELDKYTPYAPDITRIRPS